MDVLFHMIILAGIFYCVLKNDLRVHHKKACSRAILLALISGLVHFLLKGMRLEGFREGNKKKGTKKAMDASCNDHTSEDDCYGDSDISCAWDKSSDPQCSYGS